MKVIRHGFSIGIERIETRFYLSLKAIGKLRHEDYETITPMIDSALEGVSDPIVNIFIDASEFEGWEVRAAWDDFKLGLKHGKEIKKIAIFGPEKKWQSVVSKMGNWFICGEIKFFEDSSEALTWLDE
jgi:hypothetical protein